MSVNKISVDGIGALVSHIEPDPSFRVVENALLHHQVVNKALQSFSAVIPCRFGTLLRDESAIVSLLEKYHCGLRSHLDKLRGKVEVGVKVILCGPLEQDELGEYRVSRERFRPGERYLFEKMAKCRKVELLKKLADNMSMALKEATAPCWTDARIEAQPLGDNLMLALCFLIDRAKLICFKRHYEKFRKQHPDCQFLYTGSWPPYTFANYELCKM